MVEVEVLSYNTLAHLLLLSVFIVFVLSSVVILTPAQGHETLIWMLHFRPRANEHMLSVCEKRINVWHEVEKEALEKHSSKLQCTIQIGTGGRCGDSKNTKQSWLSAQFLQKPYDAHIIASSYDLAVSIHEVSTGAQILHFYHRYPIYCISSPQDDSCPYFGDSAGNVLTFCPS